MYVCMYVCMYKCYNVWIISFTKAKNLKALQCYYFTHIILPINLDTNLYMKTEYERIMQQLLEGVCINYKIC